MQSIDHKTTHSPLITTMEETTHTLLMNVTRPATTTATPLDLGEELGKRTVNLLGVVLNVTAFAGILRHRQLTRSFKVPLIGLMISDLVTNLFMFALTALRLLYVQPGQVPCLVLCSIGITAVWAGPPLFAMMSIDRFQAIFMPRHYRSKSYLITTSTVSGILCFVLTFCVLVPVMLLYPTSTPSTGCSLLRISNKMGMTLAGLWVLCPTVVAIVIYIAVVIKLTAIARINRVNPMQIRPNEADALTQRVTRKSIALAVWYTLTFLPLGCYILAFEISQKEAVLRQMTRVYFMEMLNGNAPVFCSMVGPLIVLYQLGACRSLALRCRRCVVANRRTRVGPDEPGSTSSYGHSHSFTVSTSGNNRTGGNTSTTVVVATPEPQASSTVGGITGLDFHASSSKGGTTVLHLQASSSTGGINIANQASSITGGITEPDFHASSSTGETTVPTSHAFSAGGITITDL